MESQAPPKPLNPPTQGCDDSCLQPFRGQHIGGIGGAAHASFHNRHVHFLIAEVPARDSMWASVGTTWRVWEQAKGCFRLCLVIFCALTLTGGLKNKVQDSSGLTRKTTSLSVWEHQGTLIAQNRPFSKVHDGGLCHLCIIPQI